MRGKITADRESTGRWLVTPANAGAPIQVAEAPHLPGAATVTSTTQDFVRWATARASWRELATLCACGESSVTAFLDRLNII